MRRCVYVLGYERQADMTPMRSGNDFGVARVRGYSHGKCCSNVVIVISEDAKTQNSQRSRRPQPRRQRVADRHGFRAVVACRALRRCRRAVCNKASNADARGWTEGGAVA